jgi:superfamily II DNA or RNA helicase
MLVLTPVDNVYIRIDCDDAIARELSDYFAFDQPGSQFMRRTSRFKGWDGKIRLFKLNTHKIYRGLIPRIYEFAETRDYKVTNNVPGPDPLWKVDADLVEFIESLGLPHVPDDYQWAALRYMLNNERGIVQAPTGSGKSLILYMLCRALDVKTLVIVPTLGLVKQLVNDFASYGYTGAIHTIHQGQSKSTDTDITVSTWQSLFEQDAEYFDQFDCIIVDEVHGAKAKSLTGILEKCTATYRFGVTGTIDNTECHRLILEGLFGTIEQVATTSELVKRGRLSKPKVIVLVLNYPDFVKKEMRRSEYQEEIDFLCTCEARNKFIAYLARETKGPTLTLFQLVQKHGASLYERFKAVCGTRQVWYVTGDMPADERELIRKRIVESGADDELLATYGTTQLGINIPNLRNLIFAHPSKSIIRVLQSIGRVLRLSDGKEDATIIDIVDDLRFGRWVNHTFRHAEARMQYYTAEDFRPILRQVDLSRIAEIGVTARPAPAGATNDEPDEPECPNKDDRVQGGAGALF